MSGLLHDEGLTTARTAGHEPPGSPLRVLMTADPITDVWPYVCELISALPEHRVEVVLAVMGARLNEEQLRTLHSLQNVEVVENPLALEWMPDPWYEVDSATDWLRELVQRHAIDVVHVNGFAHAAVDFGVPVLCSVHACAVTRLRAIHRREPGPQWIDYRARVAAGLRAAAEVIAPTAARLTEILAAPGVRHEGRVIPIACSEQRCPPAPKRPFVLAAGRLWDEALGLLQLDQAAASLAWPIRVAGPTNGPGGQLRPACLDVLGRLEPAQVFREMGHASIFALPAAHEPLGLTVLQAALAGCALVLGDLPAFRETWGEHAEYVPPGDATAIKRKLQELIRDPAKLSALAAGSRSRALELTPSRMAAAYRATYDELIHAARGRTQRLQ